MLNVKNNIITLTRGDHCALKVDIKDISGVSYPIKSGDSLVFTMRKKVESEEILIQKSFDGDVLNLVSEDTLNLEFGAYVYDIVLTLSTGEVYTVIPISTFNVSKEVHN